jgi:hypothetical protein
VLLLAKYPCGSSGGNSKLINTFIDTGFELTVRIQQDIYANSIYEYNAEATFAIEFASSEARQACAKTEMHKICGDKLRLENTHEYTN